MAREAITHHRKQKRLSQRALGALIRLDAQAVSRIELGYRDVSPAEASALATALGATLVELGIAKAVPPSVPTRPVDPVQPTANAAPQVASQNDLSIPQHFRLMPDDNLLKNAETGDPKVRQVLSEQAKFAEKVLHTSGVSAPTWVAWRNFHRRACELLRAG